MPQGGPQLELGVAGGPQLEHRIVVPVVQLDARDHLRVAAIEALGETQHRAERADAFALLLRQVSEDLVPPLGRRLPVIARDERHDVDLLWLEAAQVAVSNEVERVLVVAFVADVHADVVQQRGVLQPFALPIREAVHASRLVEQSDREARDLLRVLRPVPAALGELDNAPPPHIRVALCLRDLLPMPRDIVEHDAFAQ
jgi:hypothetical protein